MINKETIISFLAGSTQVAVAKDHYPEFIQYLKEYISEHNLPELLWGSRDKLDDFDPYHVTIGEIVQGIYSIPYITMHTAPGGPLVREWGILFEKGIETTFPDGTMDEEHYEKSKEILGYENPRWADAELWDREDEYINTQDMYAAVGQKEIEVEGVAIGHTHLGQGVGVLVRTADNPEDGCWVVHPWMVVDQD